MKRSALRTDSAARCNSSIVILINNVESFAANPSDCDARRSPELTSEICRYVISRSSRFAPAFQRPRFAAIIACFRAKIDDPVGAFDHLEIVLDDDERVTAHRPGAERASSSMATSSKCRPVVGSSKMKRLPWQSRHFPDVLLGFRKMPNELQTLRFATGERVERLAESQITETDFIQNIERLRQRFRFADLREKMNRFADGHLEHIVNRFAVQVGLQHVRLESFSFALGAANIKIAQELHLDFFETGA